MFVTIYQRPNGNTNLIEITNVYPEDEEWFESRGVLVSMEELSLDRYAIYADVGLTEDDDETPMELIHITKAGETCQEAMSALRKICEEALS